MKQISLLLRIKPKKIRACGAAKPTQPWILSWIYLGWNYVLSQLTRDSQPVENQGVVTGNKEIEVWGKSSGSCYCFPYALLEFVQEPQRKRILLLTICPPQAEIFWGCTHRFEELRRIWRSKSVWKWRKTTRESSKKRDFFPRRLTAPLRVQKTTDFFGMCSY